MSVNFGLRHSYLVNHRKVQNNLNKMCGGDNGG
jgi:hypothetical protein